VLRTRETITLTKPLAVPKARRVRREGEIACDDILFDRLRTLRKQLADERGVPAYVIFGDATLRQMARDYPTSAEAMHGVFGMGEKKHAEFAATFAEVVADHVAQHGRVAFSD